MSFDFSNLDVRQSDTAVCYLSALQVEHMDVPYLVMRPATSATPGYFNALLKFSAQIGATGAANMTVAQLNNIREKQRQLFAEHIVVGWDNIFNSKKQKVEFSKIACREFLTAIPDWVFSDIVVFAGESRNFIQEVDAEAVQEKAGK